MRSFLQWLLNIDPQALGSDAQLSVRFNSALEIQHVVLLAVAVVAFAVWIYRRDGRATASPALRSFLGVLRALLIGVAIFILAEPVLLATHIEIPRPVAVVLIDDSFSMDLKFADAQEPLRKQLQAAMGHAQVTLLNPEGKPITMDASKLDASQFKMLNRLNAISAALSVTPASGKTFLDALREERRAALCLLAHDLRNRRQR